ncbi:LamG-like jellyroll fold domain-containing protein [Haloferula sargassicola]|uniref:LamG-like jellyroll fold domain-containing protein n=1 Tax=Haloferula sargassicola TaxID=490096 RepID=A0ABP9UTS2_9BACT
MKTTTSLALLAAFALAPLLRAGDGPGGVGVRGSDLRLWMDSRAGYDLVTSSPRLIRNFADGSVLSPATDRGVVTQVIRDNATSRDSKALTATDCVLALKLNESSTDGPAHDRFDSSRSGTYFGHPVAGMKFYGSSGVEFDGTNGVSLPANGALEALTGDYEVSVWIKPSSLVGRQPILTAEPSASGGFALALNGDHLLVNDWAVAAYDFTNLKIKAHEWTHIHMIVRFPFGTPRKTVQIRLNGGEVFGQASNSSTLQINTNLTPPSNTRYYVAKVPGFSDGFHGAIADLHVYGHAGPANPQILDYELVDIIETAKEHPLNHRAAVRFNSSNRDTARSAPTMAVSDTMSLFAVSRYDAPVYQDGETQSVVLRSTNGNFFAQIPDRNGKVSFHLGGSVFSGYDTAAGTIRGDYQQPGFPSKDQFRIWSMITGSGGAINVIREDGRVIASGNPNPTGGFDTLSIGNDSLFSGSGPAHEIGEVILYNRRLEDPEATLVTNYLSAKFGKSRPAIDLFAGDDPSMGDYDFDLIGILNTASSKHDASTGGGLTLEDVDFLRSSGGSGVITSNSFLAAHNQTAVKGRFIPATIASVIPREWFFDVRTEFTGTQVHLAFDYHMSVDPRENFTVPPHLTHHLLFRPTRTSDYEIVATIDRDGSLVDFGNLTVGPDEVLKTGYYAIGCSREATSLLPTAGKTFEVRYDSTVSVVQRSGNVWRVPFQESFSFSAESAIGAAITAINAEPNDGTVNYLDLRGLKLPGTAAPSSANTFRLVNSGFAALLRNTVVEGPSDIPPGRLVFTNSCGIGVDGGACVELRHLYFDGCAGQGFAGALDIHTGDVFVRNCVFKNNTNTGASGSFPNFVTTPGANARPLGVELGFTNTVLLGAAPERASDDIDFVSPRPPLYQRSSGGDGSFAQGGAAGGRYNEGGANTGTLGGVGGFGACDGAAGFETPKVGGGSAALGGAIFIYRGNLRIENSGFLDNSAVGGTGGSRLRINPDGSTSVTSQAAGYGGAVFAWDEARVESFRDSILSGNISDNATDNPFDAPIAGVNNGPFYGGGFPSAELLAETSATLDLLTYINPITGAVNDDAITAYQYLLYQKEGPLVKPRYDLFDTTIATDAKVAAFVAALAPLKARAAADPDSVFTQRLLLDSLHHLASIYGIKGDSAYQNCVSAPLDPGFVSTNLSQEIDELTAALGFYEQGIMGYVDCLKQPVVFQAFRKLVPSIPYQTYYYADAGTYQAVPAATTAGVSGLVAWESTRYRDLALLFELLDDYGRGASRLVETLVRRNLHERIEGEESLPADRDLALQIANRSQVKLQGWGDALLAVFGDDLVMSPETTPGLERSVANWRQALSELGTAQSALKGETNPIGYANDFLMLLPNSDIATLTGNLKFHSFDGFIKILDPTKSGSPMKSAKDSFQAAVDSNGQFEESQDKLTEEATKLISSARERLREITGKYPEETGFDTPWLNVGSAFWEQFQNIDRAKSEITRNRIHIDNLNEEIRIEIKRVEDQKGINIKRDDLVIEYGDKVSKIDDQIAAIEISQNALGGITDALDPELISGGPLGLAVLGAKLFNVAAQAGAEVGKAELESQKDELATQQMKDETALDNESLDIDSKAFIATRLLDMKELDLDSQVAAQNLRQEAGRLAALTDEIQRLLKNIEEAQTTIQDRVYADPSQRLRVSQEYQDYLFDFRLAQQWLFFATRALEYKKNGPFNDGVNTLDTLFKIRSYPELEDYYEALIAFDNATGATDTQQNDWFSLREDSYGIEPTTAGGDGEFRNHFELVESGPRAPYYRLVFSTLRTPSGGAFFSTNEYLDKIGSFKMLMTFGSTPASNRITARIRYGDVSYFRDRTAGFPNPASADELESEFITYINRDWALGAWNSSGTSLLPNRYVQVRFNPISIPVRQRIEDGNPTSDDAAIAPETEFTAFRERSVAATRWELEIPTTNLSPAGLADVKDIRIKFQHFSSPRQ